MNTNENATPPAAPIPAAQVELDLQEAIAQRHRAAELFGAPDWEDDADEPDEDD